MDNDKPFVDLTKNRVKIVLGIPMYNELAKGHLHETIENALSVGFDHIIILDDGSTDDSWLVLQEYAIRYQNISIYRNESNSVIYEGNNRWKFIVDRIAEHEPDWVVVRSADQIYSYKATIIGGDLFRERLTELYYAGAEMISLPLAHLWRSISWYRLDNTWGRDIKTHSKSPIWRFHPGYNYIGREQTGTHRGWHHPTSFGFGDKRILKKVPINKIASPPWEIVILHLGHTTHAKKVLKFEWSMEAAKSNALNGRSNTMPPPEKMPPVKDWDPSNHKYDGYVGFYEFNMLLKKVEPQWFAGNISFDSAQPIPESMYNIILRYNKERAEEYRILYEQYYKTKIETYNEKINKFEGEIK